MDTATMIAELEAERDRLNNAIAALQGVRTNRTNGRKRHLSAAARKRISDAQKRRWAVQRKKNS